MTTLDRRSLWQGAAGATLAVAAAISAAPAAAQEAPLHVMADLVAKPGQEDALRQLLVAFAAGSRKEPGCLSYELLEVQGTPGHFVTNEVWSGRPALDVHMTTPQMKAAGDMVGPMLAKPFTQMFFTLIKT